MALVVNDRVKETSTTTGTGTLTLDGAVTGFETFSSAIGNTNTTYYAIELPDTAEFEVGLGTVAAGTLARTTVISSSNSDALVNFSAGTKNVFCTLPASKAIIADGSDNVTLPADLTVDTDTLYVDSTNGRVGISAGTSLTSPGLEIGGNGSTNGRFTVSASTGSEWFSVGATSGLVRFNSQGGTTQVAGASSVGARMNIGQLSASAAALALVGGYANNILEVNSANADLGGDLMVIDQNGLVGIGTTSPSSALDVSGGITADSNNNSIIHDITRQTGATNASRPVINLTAKNTAADVSDGFGPALEFKLQDNTADTQLGAIGFIRDGADGSGAFVVGQDSQFLHSLPQFLIDSSGNVGVGTTNPQQKFHVEGSQDMLQFLNSTDAIAESVIADSGGSIKYGTRDSGEFAIFVGGSANSYFANGSSEALRIDSSGNVGIGTSSPADELHISTGDGFNPPVIRLEAGGGQLLRITGMGNGTDSEIRSEYGLDLKSNIDDVHITTGSTERVTVKQSGNVGIGTTNPGHLLHVESTGSASIMIRADSDNVDETHTARLSMTQDGATSSLFDVGIEGNAGTEFTGSLANAPYIHAKNASSQPLQLAHVGSVIMTLRDGNVGIGTSNPSTLLHLSSSDPQITITDTDGTGSQVISASTDDLKFDVVGKTVIDSDSGGTLQLVDGGTSYLKFFEFGTYAALESMISDNDFKIRGNDGGSFIDAVTFDMSEAGDATFNSNIYLGDNKKANFGDSNDLQIFHNANNSVILDNGTGSLSLQSNGTYVGLYDAANTNHMVLANVGADVQLYHNGSQKLATTASGIDVTGTAVTDGLTVAGNVSVDGGTIKLDGNYPTGTDNLAMGDTALDSVTSGTDNTVIGSGAGTAVTTGYQNTVVGSTALNTGNGTANTAIGYRALRAITGAGNVGVGSRAGHDASGGQNTFVGGNAGYYISGTNNVAVGYQAGNGFGTTGSSNIFMGFRAGDNITNGSNNIIIGTSADASSATASNEITLGDANITSLRIPGLQSGASSGDVLTFNGTDITLSTPSTGVSAGFAVAMAIAL